MKWVITLFALLFFQNHSHFSPDDLYKEIPNGSEPTAHIAPLLTGCFSYLGQGAQTYAFLSEDGKTVLKLFKARHKRPFKWKYLLRSPADREISALKWKRKFQETCRRYKWAFIDLKEETGLLYLHFEKTAIPIPVTLEDGEKHQVDLASYPFILQKKATLTPDYLKKYPEKKEEAKKALRSFFAKRLEKGYSDPRQSLSINYGFIGDQPIQIDVGKIEPFTGTLSTELERIHKKIEVWFSDHENNW